MFNMTQYVNSLVFIIVVIIVATKLENQCWIHILGLYACIDMVLSKSSIVALKFLNLHISQVSS